MRQAQYVDADLGARLQFEHICLESEEPLVVARAGQIRVGPAFRFVSWLRGRETELAFTTDQRLSIRWRRRGKPVRKCVVDLRFVDAHAIAERRNAWRWWLATSSLAGAGLISAWLASQLGQSRLEQVGLRAAVVLTAAALLVAALGLYRNRPTIELRSVHGDARLAEVVGSLGDARKRETFIAELARRIEAARGQPPQTKRHFLRDEMREHHRLWSEGVLSDAAYEASKRRILAAHA